MHSFEVGQKVEWTSQAAGSAKTKVGAVHAIVPAGRDAFSFIPDGVSRSRIKFDTHYADEIRYIVAVPRGAAHDYYCPRRSQLRMAEGG
ncbi:hypothetical protein [Paenibacillus rubinfantis]|uniref:hypothetical protein n=1 Tax=Paenibacillus rubinfantis TaxID=1720296 RepID=UPI00073F0BF9|nr:hypothetical protein [Paenibacillus rubinfantis]